jgi:hypothetical protein
MRTLLYLHSVSKLEEHNSIPFEGTDEKFNRKTHLFQLKGYLESCSLTFRGQEAFHYIASWELSGVCLLDTECVG